MHNATLITNDTGVTDCREGRADDALGLHRSPSGSAFKVKLAGIQYLRALAAISVVIFHAAGRAGEPFWVGEAGVDLFFLLSGFLMVAITDDSTRPVEFLQDRVRRIVPMYWIATSVLLCAGLAGLFPQLALKPLHVVMSYLFIPSAHPITGMAWPLLVPGWTLNYEMFFYTLFAASMGIGSQKRQILLVGAALAAMVAFGQAMKPEAIVARFYTDPILLEFVAGMAIGYWWKKGEVFPSWMGAPLLLASLVLFLYAWTLGTDDNRVIIFGIPAGLALVGVLAHERRKPIASHRLPMMIGNASYSIYLWHTLAVSVAAKICASIDLPPGAVVPIGVTLGLLAGLAGYGAVERPIIRHFARKRSLKGESASLHVTGPGIGASFNGVSTKV